MSIEQVDEMGWGEFRGWLQFFELQKKEAQKQSRSYGGGKRR